ncbi:MAG: hypothetical protein COA75_14840 [Cellvibrionales bacterium]|nr:MAG: hypothetical protein COA75_14840 [Cellvibrionales bacterium]
MNPMPIIIIWGALALVLITYVIYRFTTDKSGNKKKHALYPFVSNSSDPALPSNKLELFCYFFISAGIAGILLQLAQETNLLTITPLALRSLQACIPIGVILFFIVKVKGRG